MGVFTGLSQERLVSRALALLAELVGEGYSDIEVAIIASSIFTAALVQIPAPARSELIEATNFARSESLQ